MGFRDFITSRLFRRKLTTAWEQFQNIKPPDNPSRKYIDQLVERLLDDETAWNARKELSMIGAAAAPSLSAALANPQFHEKQRKDWRVPVPLEIVLELLVPHGPDQVLAAAMPLVASPSEEVRETAALQLASLGRAETVPLLIRLLEDSDGYVRSAVVNGAERALSQGRCSEEFRQKMYEALLNQCDQNWPDTTNESPRTVIALDSARAVIDFGSPRWLSSDNRNVHQILEAANKAHLALPEKLVRGLLDYSLPLTTAERCYPHQYVVAAALEALARCMGDRARPLLETAIGSDKDQIQKSAAKGLALLVGLDNPFQFVLDRLKAVAFDRLTIPQRTVFYGHVFDAEVCNGGIMQFFGNSSGADAVETLEALRVLAHPEAQHALDTAMRLIGPLSREPDRELRMAAFEGRYDELCDRFGPLESSYYKKSGLFFQRMIFVRHRKQGTFQIGIDLRLYRVTNCVN